MRNMETVNSEGVAKSRGYAFIDFSEHSYALGVLRALNNNPEVFTDDKVPVSLRFFLSPGRLEGIQFSSHPLCSLSILRALSVGLPM